MMRAMRVLTRPSHFMLLLLLLAGMLVCFAGELFLPEQGKAAGSKRGESRVHAKAANNASRNSESQLNAVLIHPGRSDMLSAGSDGEGRRLAVDDVSQASKDEPLYAKSNASPTSNEEQLNKLLNSKSGVMLVGNIWRELWNVDKKATAMSAAGLTVNLELVSTEVDAAKRPSPIFSTCDAQGMYAMPEIPSGRYRLRALLPDDSENLSISLELEIPESAPKEQDSHGNDELRQDILLPYHRTMRGTLVSKNGSNLTGIKISVREGGIDRGSVIVDEEGKFSLPKVGKGPFEFNLQGQKGSAISLESVKTEDESQRQIPVSLSMQ